MGSMEIATLVALLVIAIIVVLLARKAWTSLRK